MKIKPVAATFLFGWFFASLFAMNKSIPFDLRYALDWKYDAFGRPLVDLILQGSGRSGAIAALATSITVILGMIGGGFLALTQQPASKIAGRLLDLFLAFPPLLIAMALAAVQKPGLSSLVFAMTLGALPAVSRMIYVRALEIVSEDFVQAALALGATPSGVIYRHLLPGLWSWIRVKIPSLFSTAVLSEATLTLMGIGAPAGLNTWGSLLHQSRDYLMEAPHIAVFCCFPLIALLLALQVVLKEFDT